MTFPVLKLPYKVFLFSNALFVLLSSLANSNEPFRHKRIILDEASTGQKSHRPAPLLPNIRALFHDDETPSWKYNVGLTLEPGKLQYSHVSNNSTWLWFATITQGKSQTEEKAPGNSDIQSWTNMEDKKYSISLFLYLKNVIRKKLCYGRKKIRINLFTRQFFESKISLTEVFKILHLLLTILPAFTVYMPEGWPKRLQS